MKSRRVEGDAVPVAAVATTAIAPAGSVVATSVVDGDKPARKRRRRRGGKPVENAADNTSTSHVAAVKPAAKSAKPVEAAAANKSEPSLLSRIGKGLKSLVTRAPRNQH